MGETKANAIKNALGVSTIGELADLKAEKLSVTVVGVSGPALRAFHKTAQDVNIEAFDRPLVNHYEAKNPYKSRYGAAMWESKVRAELRTAGHVCITELVEHMITQSAAVMKGTAHEDDWVFYHDALTQMTDRACISWMKEKGYYKRWVLPLKDLNAGTVYDGRPVGNSPEMMCLDCSLFKDVADAVNRHVSITSKLADDDPRKFMKNTPQRLLHAYLRIVDPVSGVSPTSERIIQDVERCWDNHLWAIFEARGTVVPGLGSRNGHRRAAPGPRGGTRVKGPPKQGNPLHADAKGLSSELTERVINERSQRHVRN